MAADPAATASEINGGASPRAQSSTGRGGGKTAARTGLNRDQTKTSGALSTVQLAPCARVTPRAGLLACPQQDREFSWEEEEGEGSYLGASARQSGSSTVAAGGVQKYTALARESDHAPSSAEELVPLSDPSATVSCRRWWRICGERTASALRFVWTTMTVTITLIAAFLAILTTFWALSPVCTSCVRSSRRPNSEHAVMTLGETGWSTLRINQLQVIGTHNSYHRRSYVPAMSDFWNYHYPSLTSQLDAGVRHLELDIHYDWKTGRWFVFHLSVLDPMSTCNCLSECLEEIREWSDAHPSHHILFIEIELKLTGDFLQLCGQKTPDANRTAFQRMQRTVVDKFPRDRILTPREVRGDYETLAEAITSTTAAWKLFKPTSSSSSTSSDSDSSSWAPFEDGAESAEGDGGDESSASSTGQRLRSSSSSSSSRNNGSSSGSGSSERSAVVSGGWPLVDDTRGMVLFVIDYQSTNRLCRPAVRKALPEDITVFFERTPMDEVGASPFLAFGETSAAYKIRKMVRSGVIVRNRVRGRDWNSASSSEDEGGEEQRPTYIVDTPAQLVVWDDLRAVRERTTTPKKDDADDGMPTPLPCRSRCSAIVPEEQCVLEGFC
ncbi:unnamed protein product [Scytosiphon promiscuus]